MDLTRPTHEGAASPTLSAHQTGPPVDGPGEGDTGVGVGATEDTRAPQAVWPRPLRLPLAALHGLTQTLGHVAVSGPVHTGVDLYQRQGVGPQITGPHILPGFRVKHVHGMCGYLYWAPSIY